MSNKEINNNFDKNEESIFAKTSHKSFAKEMLFKINNGMRFIWLSGAISIFLIIILDQLSKQLAQYFLGVQSHSVTIIPYLLDFTLVYNDGAAFGSMAGNRFFLISSSLVMGLAMVIFLMYQYKNMHQVTRVALYMMIAGCFGNFIDRAFYPKGLVIDFIDMPWIFFWTNQRPVFNIADVSLVVGVAVLLIGVSIVMIHEHVTSRKKLESLEIDNVNTKKTNIVNNHNDDNNLKTDVKSNENTKKESVKINENYIKEKRNETVSLSKDDLRKLNEKMKGDKKNGRT